MLSYQLYALLAKAARAEEESARLRLAIETNGNREELKHRAEDLCNLLTDVKVSLEEETRKVLEEKDVQ